MTQFQNWRAMAIFKDGSEQLLWLDTDDGKVRRGYNKSFFDILTPEEQANIRKIELQKWGGHERLGRWVNKGTIPLPEAVPSPASEPVKDAAPAEAEPVVVL